jgi:hypothetical protein
MPNIVSGMSDIMKERTLRLDFSEAPLKNRAFSEKPMSFVDEAPKALLGAIIDVVAIETGNRARARALAAQAAAQPLAACCSAIGILA